MKTRFDGHVAKPVDSHELPHIPPGLTDCIPRGWPEYVASISTQVGSDFDPPALLNDLLVLEGRYEEVVGWDGGPGANQREQRLLQRYKLAKRLLAMETTADPPRGGLLASFKHQAFVGDLRAHVEGLADQHDSMTNKASFQIAIGKGPKYEMAKRNGIDFSKRRSPFEILVGGNLFLQAIFQTHFHKKPGKGRNALQPDSPYIRFTLLTLELLRIRTSTGKPYSREAIIRAMSPREAGAAHPKGKKR